MAQEADQTLYVQHLRVQNSLSEPVVLCLEPWGEELLISPNATYELAARGPEGDCLHVDFAPGRITIYGWSGSVISVYEEGKMLKSCEIPVPATPRKVGDAIQKGLTFLGAGQMRLNSKMSALLKEADIPGSLSDNLRSKRGELPAFEIDEDSVLLKSEFEKNRHVRVTEFPDRTGFESFINHVHLPFNGTRESLLACLTYADALRRGLTHLAGPRHFKIIVSVAGNGCTVRFHQARTGENWIAENLESYTDEAILVLDIP